MVMFELTYNFGGQVGSSVYQKVGGTGHMRIVGIVSITY
jgi:hypothetical protein